MRKRIIAPVQQKTTSPDQDWLNVESLAEVEITSCAKEWGQVLQSYISRLMAGSWCIWFLRSVSCVWFDERERPARPAHQLDRL